VRRGVSGVPGVTVDAVSAGGDLAAQLLDRQVEERVAIARHLPARQPGHTAQDSLATLGIRRRRLRRVIEPAFERDAMKDAAGGAASGGPG
jgi:hypothetical protein